MDNDRPQHRRQRRGGPACDGGGPGRGPGRQTARGGESSLGGRTTTRALIAAGAYVAQDLRDAEGLMRPMLRRAARRLALSRREPARRLGDAYLRLDPPAPGVDPRSTDIIEVSAAAPFPALAAAPSLELHVAEGQGARVEVGSRRAYHEHMPITIEEPNAASTD
jgi:hypothetical protein